MPEEKLGHPPPIVQAMVLADYVHQDSSTGKKYILGTHNSLMSSKFPTKHSFYVYLAVTGGHGKVILRMRIVDVDESIGSIHESVYPIDLSDPTRALEITFGTTVLFPEPGDYRIQLFTGNDLLRELRLGVSLRPRNTPPA